MPGAQKLFIGVHEFGRHFPEVFDRLREAGLSVELNETGRRLTEDELASRAADADAILVGLEPVTARVIAGAPRLKVISRHGVGYDTVDLAAARARGIPVTLTTGIIVETVAEMAIALMLAIARQIPKADAQVRAGEWPRLPTVELKGKTLGILGLGQIGKAVCLRARGFQMRLLAYDPRRDEAFAAGAGVEFASIDRILAESHFVSLHLPATPGTRHFMNRERLRAMKEGAYLINTARGALVDETALCDALREGHLAGAASDVFENEPPGDHPLLKLDNFIATPHIASSTLEGLQRMGMMAVENVIRVLNGQPPLAQVEPPSAS